ncbi:hypothetical protein [Enterococcus phage 156]|nr:hypothetical protein [Enterococcus phage 156]VDB76892.1 hypothetical protein PHI156_103 [Enterococcus phage 156]
MNFHDKVFEVLSRDYPDWQKYQTGERPYTSELRKGFAIDSSGTNKLEVDYKENTLLLEEI